jgi:serine/threonine protein kinase
VMKGILNESAKTGVPGYVVAMKIPNQESSSEQIDELRMEAAIMAQFSHPNVVGLIGQVNEKVEVQTEDGQTLIREVFVLIAQFCEYGSLLKWLKGPDGSHAHIPTLTRMALDVARGMEYLSKIGIVHRDLAARNVLVSSDLSCKISDFGFARHSETGTVESDSNFQVAIRWVAPEVISTRGYTSSSDIWSFAVLLFELYSFGQVPYPEIPVNREHTLIPRILSGYRLNRPLMCLPKVYQKMLESWELRADLRPDFPEWRIYLDKILFECSGIQEPSMQQSVNEMIEIIRAQQNPSQPFVVSSHRPISEVAEAAVGGTDSPIYEVLTKLGERLFLTASQIRQRNEEHRLCIWICFV